MKGRSEHVDARAGNSPGAKLIGRLLTRARDRDVILNAFAPFDSDHPADSILAEVDVLIGSAWDVLAGEDETTRNPQIGRVSELLHIAQMRLQCVQPLVEETIHEVRAETRDLVSLVKPPADDSESRLVSFEMLRKVDTELAALRALVMSGPDSDAEERRCEAICVEIDRVQRLARTAADIVSAVAGVPARDAEE